MKHVAAVRILITLPPRLKQFLEDLRHHENRTASGHIQDLLREDLRSRTEDGWKPKSGWKYRESPAYQRKEYESWQRFKKWSDQNTLKQAKQIEKARLARKRKT